MKILETSNSILLVQLPEQLSLKIGQDLQDLGYDAVFVTDLHQGLGQVQTLQPALILIDQSQAGEAGFTFCRQLRSARCRTPILMFMATETIADRVACLESGADDYLLKPYRSDQLTNLINLYLQPPSHPSEQLRFGDLVLDLNTRRAIRKGREFDLTMKEFELLRYLMTHPRDVVTREQILENVWGYDFMGESNVIEVYIRYLRLKIEDEGEKRLIQTVRGVGYVLREP